MSPLRVGLVGAGSNVRAMHIPGFAAIDGVEVTAVANRSRSSAEQVAQAFSIPRIYDTWQEVVEDPEIDAVCIGTWPHLHRTVTEAALAAGKHVLCEARMAMNVDEARSMLAASQASDRVAMIVPSPLGLAGDRYVTNLVADGYLGEVREIVVRWMTSEATDPTTPLHWRHQAEHSGDNIMVLGILNETVQRWFGRAVEVGAHGATFVPRRVDGVTGLVKDVESPDSIFVTAAMATGASCLYHLTGHARFAGRAQLAVYGSEGTGQYTQTGTMSIEAYGTEGTLVYDFATDTLAGARLGDEGVQVLPIPAELRSGWRVEADFVDSIRSGAPVTRTSFADGVRYMQFTTAVRHALAHRRQVAVDEV